MKAITSNEAFEKIKVMAQRTMNPCQRILLNEIVAEVSLSPDTLFVLMIELENRGLIRIHRSDLVSISLTNYGVTQSLPTTGLDSE